MRQQRPQRRKRRAPQPAKLASTNPPFSAALAPVVAAAARSKGLFRCPHHDRRYPALDSKEFVSASRRGWRSEVKAMRARPVRQSQQLSVPIH